MLVQSRKTKRELDMYWIEVCSYNLEHVEPILKRYTKDRDEGYKAIPGEIDELDIRFRVVSTHSHHVKLITKLVEKELLEGYQNYM